MADIYVNANWQIVLTKASCEKKVAAAFAKKDIEHYWPLNTFRSHAKNPAKLQQEPLFKSYIFVRILDTQADQVLKTSGVINFVYWLNKPALIKDAEIETIRLFLRQYHYLHIEKTEVDINESVKNIRGSSITKEGNVTEILHNATKAILPSLGYILISQIPENTHSEKVILNNIHYIPTEKLTVKENM
jgi:transcriptional antiterminator NusG